MLTERRAVEQDKQVLDFCEAALENVLGNIIREPNQDRALTRVESLLRGWSISIPQEARLELVVAVVVACMRYVRRGKHLAGAAGHPEFDPNSGDAELGLLVTKSLVGYLSKLRDNK